MHGIEAQMKEILRRKACYLVRRQVRKLAFVGSGLVVLLAVALLSAPGVNGSVEHQVVSTLGATILGPEAGGYVIVALLAFGLGIVVAMISMKYRQAKRERSGRSEDAEP